MNRRVFLQLTAALPTAALLPAACGGAPRFLSDDERRVLAACANAIFPSDASGPGAADLGAVDYIEALLTALDHDPPRVHAAGPFSDRVPFPNADGSASSRYPENDFKTFLPLSRVQRAGWQLRILGSAGTPGGGPNDAVLGPVVGLRDLLRDGIASAVKAAGRPVSEQSDADLEALYDLLPPAARDAVDLLVVQSLFALPEYGGNRDAGGWRAVHYEGDSLPRGYTVFDAQRGAYQDRPDAPVLGPAPADPDPMDADIIAIYSAAATILGGKRFY